MKLEIEATPVQMRAIADALYTMSSRKLAERQRNDGYMLAVICQEWKEREMELRERKRGEQNNEVGIHKAYDKYFANKDPSFMLSLERFTDIFKLGIEFGVYL